MMLAAPLLVAALALQQAPTLTLPEALRQAEQQNLDLVSARARLTQARELSRKAWAGYLPQLSAQGQYTYNSVEAKIAQPAGFLVRDTGQPQGPTFDPTLPPSPDNPPGAPTPYILYPADMVELEIQKRHQLTGTARLSQALLAPALWPQIGNAYLGEQVAELSVETARREILFAVIQLYLGAEGLREAVEVQERLLEVNREHEKDAELQVRAGTAPRVVLVRAQIQRTRAEQDLLRTKNSYAASLSSLAVLLDREPDFHVTRPPLQPPAATEADPQALTQQALQQRPEILSAQKSLELAEGTRRSVLFSYAPMLSAFAQYNVQNVQGFTGAYDNWVAGLSLNWNLFDGGLRESQLREAGARIVESQAALRNAENKARDEVRRALLELQSAEANRVKAAEEVRLAQENHRLVNLAFEAGAGTSIEVVDANAALLSAELSLINEQLNAQLAAVRLAKASGLFDPLREATAAAPTPAP